ncbi:hypothetical protein ACFW2Y_06315 [Streptomyces sp. NPDC058877]|uniref:hypothetical protein n=1 Tax=Streptomyces sp. NPDC058877 TaxID=3346665 RepID=UPI0036AF030E
MPPDPFPRLLAGVHAIAAQESTLLTTRTGYHRSPAELYPLIHRLAPLLDGRTAESSLLARVPEPRRRAVGRCLDYLEHHGALRREDQPRPEGLPDQLLAVADLADDAPYARCSALLVAEASVRAPADWLPVLDTLLRRLSVQAELSTAPGVLVRIGETAVAIPPDDGWLTEPVGTVERAVIAAAVAAETVGRFLGRPAQPLPGARDLPGLARSGPRTSPDAPLLDQWPTPEDLRALLLDPSALLPASELACERPAAIRPTEDGTGPCLPEWLRAVLRCLHVPLRWESGTLAHSGGWAHRGIASARGFYPIELYLVTDTGAWYVEPGELRLLPVSRTGSKGAGTVGTGSRVTLVLTARETKVSYRYHRYATRLCLQEAGLALAAIGDAARTGGIGVDEVVELGTRGRGGPWGELLDLGADERPVGRVVLDPPQHLGDLSALDRHLKLVRRRQSGHRVFNALGADRVGRLGSLPAELTAAADDTLTSYLVVHRPCLDDTGNRWEPGCYRVTQQGPVTVRAGSAPTRQLQSGQDAMGWLAPDYGAASATVIVAAPVGEVTADLQRLHTATAAAARVAHRVLLGAAVAGAAGRIHNSLRGDVVAAVTEDAQIASLFQLIVGCPGPDGTISVDLG